MINYTMELNHFLSISKITLGKEFLDNFNIKLRNENYLKIPDTDIKYKKVDDIIVVYLKEDLKTSIKNLIEAYLGVFLYVVEKESVVNLGENPSLEIILSKAIEKRSTDIHIEPKNNYVVIRYRIDGKLFCVFKGELDFQSLLNRIKVLNNLDLLNYEMQDGSAEYNGKNIRTSIIPTITGEKVVIRILDKDNFTDDPEKLGFTRELSEKYLKYTKEPGLHLVVGVTGSGKNTTLYYLIRNLDYDRLNIISIEDPVEYKFDKITQIEVDELKNRTFSNLLRACLRQDPDVIYIGEIRDEITAQVAVRAALTGHIVYASLHTKSVESTISRLQDLGVDDFYINNTLKTVTSQRLVRKLCDKCKSLGENNYYHANSCECCYGGYIGRTGVFTIKRIEYKQNSDGTKELIFHTISDMKDMAQKLLNDGIIDLKTFGEINDI